MFLMYFGIALVVANFGEYLIHRLQHKRVLRAQEHAYHHIQNEPHGIIPEFWVYFRPALWAIVPTTAVIMFVDPLASLGWATGIVFQIALSAVVHEMYHTDPNLIFWMRPIHHFHHKNNEWQHNFAFGNSLWDRILRTYKDDPTWIRQSVSWRRFLDVRWV